MKINELARLSGVSPTTVSLVLNGRECRVAHETQERIRQLAHEHNYTPNHVARNLVMKRSNTIGFMTTDITNPFFATLTGEVERLVTERGFSLMLACGNGTLEEAANKIDFLCNRGVDGLLVAISENGGKEYNEAIKKKLNELSVPFIAVDRWLEGLHCPRVSIDHEMSGYVAAKYLLDAGHRKIAIITGPKGNYTARRRFGGYKRALAEYGLEPESGRIFDGDYSFESGYRLGKDVVSSGVTAVFAANDMMATGVMRRCAEMDVKVPDELSIIGIDDIFFSKMLQVPLTTVRQDMPQLAAAACKLLIEKLSAEGEYAAGDIKIPACVVERSSVKKRL